MRIIPGKTKIKIEIFKGVSLADFLLGLLFVGLITLAITSPIAGKVYVVAGLALLGVLLLVKIGDEPNYLFFLSILRHLAYRKDYRKDVRGKGSMENVMAFTAIKDGYIVYKDYYGAALEIPPVEFRFFSSYRRRISIDECLANVLRSMNGRYAANLVKLERRVPYDGYIQNERKKLNELRRSFECGMLSESEYQAKCEIVFDRMEELEKMNTEERVVDPYYYLVFFDSDKNQLRLQIDSAYSTLQRGEMSPRRLDSKDLALFLKYSNDIDFDEKELDSLSEEEYAAWAMPDTLRVKSNTAIINDITTYTMAISNYPLRVGDAWIAGVMSIPSTKVVVKLQPMDKQKTVRNIDRSISELRARYNQSGVDSTLIELADHIQSLNELLSMLQSDNEVLLNTDVYITCYDVPLTKKEGRENAVEGTSRATISNMRTVIRRAYREIDLRLASLQFNQMEGYIGSQINGYDPLAKVFGRGLPGTTAAAMYPWIYAHVKDPLGIKLGSEGGVPVFIDMFRRDSERVNSNMVIVGKSGSGKSYAAKSILVNLAADNSKIFVLDPENEYAELAENLHGKFINVGNAQQGRMNPFQIITALDDDADDTEGKVTGSYASHMQFLEEFFRQILPDCEKEALEYLNTLADRVYMNRGITAETNLSLLTAEDYPIFDDLYDEVLKEFQATDNEYLRSILRTLMNYVSKFSAGGRNANIWNGPSTISTDENFTVFNFQSLLSGGNSTVTNAQMLLVMKYIDNEIIKNREYNTRYNTNRKIVVVIDEAHVFIDEKYPIALDFMFQLAKRIRKYNGMQIVITQNIKDFVGSEDISRKSSAIINACQYSFIFPLAPNDMGDLCKLYEKAGGINENEQEKIVTAPRGNAFVILGATSRSSFQVEVPEDVVQVFERHAVESRYFAGEKGQAAWEDYLGDSREKHLDSRRVWALPAPNTEEDKPSRVTFVEISEEEYKLEQQVLFETERLKSEAERLNHAEMLTAEPAVAEAHKPAPAEDVQMQPVVSKKTGDKGEMAQMVVELRRMVDSMASLGDVISKLQSFNASAVTASPLYAAPAMPIASTVAEKAADGVNGGGLAASVGIERTEPQEKRQDIISAETAAQLEGIESELNEEPAPEYEEKQKSLEELLAQRASFEEISESMLEDNNSAEDSEETESDSADVEGEGSEEVVFDLFEDSEPFDFMAFLKKNAEILNNITILDDMRDNYETVRTISLEDLGKLAQNRKDSGR